MSIHESIQRQYLASLGMLNCAISACPNELWDDAAYPNRFWHIAYHVLFCTHVYLQPRHEGLVLWPGHRKDLHFLGQIPGRPGEHAETGEPYTPEAILAYVECCRNEVAARVPGLDFDAPSGFHWIPLNKFELQLYNLRHLQHHTGQLMDRLRTTAGIGVPWVVGV